MRRRLRRALVTPARCSKINDGHHRLHRHRNGLKDTDIVLQHDYPMIEAKAEMGDVLGKLGFA
ncbi:MAG: hypothetical protein R3F11_23135 [Verrucomicrobiales bacterium]